MVKKAVSVVTALVAVVVLSMVSAARAADPPKWVATVFVEAQRSVGLRWQPAPGASGYKLLRSETKGSGHVEIAAPTTPQYFDAKVESGVTYYYVLQSVAADGVSANSEERSVTIPGQKKKTILPPEWRSIQDSQTTEFGKTTYKAGLVWAKVPDAVAYNVYRSETTGAGYQLLGSVSEDQYIDATVADGKTYYYVITALDNSFQETPYSVEKSLNIKKKEEKKEEKKAANPKVAAKPSKVVWNVQSGAEYTISAIPDLAVNSDGEVYVPDSISGKVNVFAPDGTFIRSFGDKGVKPGQINQPIGIGIDSDDNVYIADRSGVSRILIFDSKGKYLREFQVPPPDEEYMKKFNRKDSPMVLDVAVGKDGRIYLTDNSLHRLIILDEKGKFISQSGEPGGDPGQFMNPGWLAINERGEVHICNGLNRRIEVFDLDGKFIRNYGMSKTFVGSFVGPTGITFDEQGNSVVSDAAMSTIQFFNPAGEYLYHLADEKGEVDKDTKQRSVLMVANTVGITYSPAKKLFFFGQGNEVQTVQARSLIQ